MSNYYWGGWKFIDDVSMEDMEIIRREWEIVGLDVCPWTDDDGWDWISVGRRMPEGQYPEAKIGHHEWNWVVPYLKVTNRWVIINIPEWPTEQDIKTKNTVPAKTVEEWAKRKRYRG
jgi:hypothetical protein